MAKSKETWMPKRSITVGGNTYLYDGDIKNTKTEIAGVREFYRERGKKITTRVDPTNKKIRLLYISVKNLYPVKTPYRLG